MAALVSNTRAMAQPPLHSFFTRQPREQVGPSEEPSDRPAPQVRDRTSGKKKSTRTNHDQGPEPDEEQDEPLRKRRRTASIERGAMIQPNGSRQASLSADSRSISIQVPQRPAELGATRPPDDGRRELGAGVKSPAERREPPRASSRNRVLKLRADGRLKSPEDDGTRTESPKPRKRRSGGKRARDVRLKYGRTPHDRVALGRRIDQIMAGKASVEVKHLGKSKELDVPAAAVGPQTTDKQQNKMVTTSDNPHPFFMNKAQKAVAAANTDAARSEETTSTPAATEKMPGASMARDRTESAFPSSFGSSFRTAVKQPGSLEALWPPHEMQHIRGLGGYTSTDLSGIVIRKAGRKAKGRKAVVNANDEVYGPQERLVRITRKSATERGCASMPEDEAPGPVKHLITGKDLQSRLANALGESNQRRPGSAASILAGLSSSASTSHLPFALHPASETLFLQVGTSLSAFDRFDCDIQDWCHKYAPKHVEQVLQDQGTLTLLRDWVRSRNVDQVDTGASSGQAKVSATKQLAAKRRKRKAKDELDDFIVSSEGESDNATEMSEPDEVTKLVFAGDNSSFSAAPAALKKLKPGNLQSTRAVLISGPHGSGKTASVYAIAAELGFEIFEINSGTRRNGRDIMEKVGDMTRNHLVDNSKVASTKIETTHDGTLNSDDTLVVEDIIDPKQQSVASFFKPKPKVRPAETKPKASKTARKQKPVAQSQPTLKPRKQQKQSLILFEEVDVLFEEDKQFWTTVFTLVVQSRRPIIMTCTDEDRLPLADFVDTACLPFFSQPREQIVDYALCLAANEGHLITRDAASRAAAIRKGDLRGTLMDLQFWCQMAIGDDRAGAGWFMDASKAMLNRTDAEPRLRTDMDALEHDALLLSEAYGFNGYDSAEHGALLSQVTHMASDNAREELLAYDLSSDVLSLADILPSAKHQFDRIDCSQPELDAKARAEYPCGFHLLQVDPILDPSGVALDIAYTLQAATRRLASCSQKPLCWKEMTKEVLTPRTPLHDHTRHIRHLTESFFEPLLDPPISTPWSQQQPAGLSVLNAPFRTIATDVAPVLRSIAKSDLRLEEERNRLSSLLIEPGQRGKRQRTTRAARAALEGGNKASTRRDRYLPKTLDYKAVLRTGGHDWADAVAELEAGVRASVGSATPSIDGFLRRDTDESADELGV